MDEYIGKFLSMNKSIEQADEAKRKEQEQLRQQQEREKQEQALVAQQAPTLWQELKRFFQSTVKEINDRNGTPILALAIVNSDDLLFRYRGHQVHARYRRDAHSLTLAAPMLNREVQYIPRVVNGTVKFANRHNDKPVESDGIMGEIMHLFVDAGGL